MQVPFWYLHFHLLLFIFPHPLGQNTHAHDHRKNDQIPNTAHAVAEHASNDHKYAAAGSKARHNKPPKNTLILLFPHPLEQDWQIHQINGDNGQLRGIKDEGTGPGAGQIG